MGPEGFTQRTSYLVSHPSFPARQVTRTVVIRPNDNSRPNDPNLPPTYDHAVTGKDKSVRVQESGVKNEPPKSDGATPTVPLDAQPSAPPPFNAPAPDGILGEPPPEYSPPSAPSHSDEDDPLVHDGTRRLLV